MYKMYRFLVLTLMVVQLNPSQAVRINPNGLGEVNIIPYYTVNNDLNTLVTVTNNTAVTKAIKVNIREGLNGYSVLSYSVYLDAFDMWSFVLSSPFLPDEEVVVVHSNNDNSCSPFLASMTDFSASELIDGPQSLKRAKEGYIEIIEMGTFSAGSDYYAAADHGTNGTPADCSFIEDAWESGEWSESVGRPNADLEPPTGGLMSAASLINVQSGINYSLPTIALDDFFAEGVLNHKPPGDSSLSLDTAEPVATVYDQDNVYEVSFERGIDAVSAVLMSTGVNAVYVLDDFVAGQTDVIFSQPTRRFYISEFGANNAPPYKQNSEDIACNMNQYGGTEVGYRVFDRNSQLSESPCITALCSPEPSPGICGSVFVLGMNPPNSQIDAPRITASENFSIESMAEDIGWITYNGFVKTSFGGTRPLIGNERVTSREVRIEGIPVIGLSLYQYTNAFAAEGLLAQYGGGVMASSNAEVTLVEDN